ncbi:OsmC family protein [Rathayibacter sp. YIM 133350]|uniref:OsmC family protein n=1 Tax=Rathayibacter sp. YIM 133350 TaxID=3131992 RepID=UPI00307F4287
MVDELLAGQRTAHGSVSAKRTGERTFEGRNERGATVRIGPEDAPDAFTPGELLKVALAACAGMSSDRVIARRLGEDFSATFWAHGVSDPATNRYSAIDEEIVLAGLDAMAEQDRAKLLDLIHRSIDKGCTVARSVEGSIDLTSTVSDVAGA